jgi:predicted acetyltransferase
MRLRHVRVAELEGRIAAHVRIFDRRMRIRGAVVRAGGIGSVASMPEARGLGLPSALLRDAIEQMGREDSAVSFLFTGIPAFYERLGWRIAREPQLDVTAHVVAELRVDERYRVRRIEPSDVPRLLAVHRAATATCTGAVTRTLASWRDAQRWLGEDRAGCLVALDRRLPVAYIRSRSRPYGYTILEAEHAPGHEQAVPALVARVARRAVALRQELTAYAPRDSTLAAVLRSLPSTRETEDVAFPTMMRIVRLDLLVDALLPGLTARARACPGPPFAVRLHAPDGQATTLDVRTPSVRRTSSIDAPYALDDAATLDVILGQRRASRLLRPRPPAAIGRRIDALFPETAFHFWNTDRI